MLSMFHWRLFLMLQHFDFVLDYYLVVELFEILFFSESMLAAFEEDAFCRSLRLEFTAARSHGLRKRHEAMTL